MNSEWRLHLNLCTFTLYMSPHELQLLWGMFVLFVQESMGWPQHVAVIKEVTEMNRLVVCDFK